MTDVITKVAIGGVVYPFAGGGSEGQEVVYLTQAEYDVLPASKLTDGKIYKVKTTGVVPGGSADASDVEYDNTTSGLTADNVQDAIDEIQTQVIKQQMQITSNVVLGKVTNTCEVPGYFVSKEIGSPMSLYTTSGTYVVGYSADSDTSFTYKNFFYGKGYTAGHSDHLYIYNINTGTVTYSINDQSIYGTKVNGNNLYIRLNSSYLKGNLDGSELEDITSTEYNEVKDYNGSYKGLFYSSEGQDIVAVDGDNVEVKRYHNVGSFSGIANDIIYRIVGDVSYAIATI